MWTPKTNKVVRLLLQIHCCFFFTDEATSQNPRNQQHFYEEATGMDRCLCLSHIFFFTEEEEDNFEFPHRAQPQVEPFAGFCPARKMLSNLKESIEAFIENNDDSSPFLPWGCPQVCAMWI